MARPRASDLRPARRGIRFWTHCFIHRCIHRNVLLGAALGLVLWAAPSVSAAAPSPPEVSSDTFDDCLEQVADQPQEAETWRCFYDRARQSGELDGAAKLLDTLRSRHGDHGPLLHNRARIAYLRGEPETPDWFRRAAVAHGETGEWEGVASCRISEARWFRLRQEVEAATEAASQARVAAERSGDPWILGKVEVQRADLMLARGEELEQASVLLEQVQHRIDMALGSAGANDPPPYTLQRDCLLTRGNVAFQLGRYGEARGHYQRYTELVESAGDRYAAATGHYNRFNTFVLDVSQRPEPGDRERAIELARRALEAAREADHLAIEATVLATLGRLVGGAEGRELLEDCVARVRDPAIYPGERCGCLRSLAENLVDSDPAAATEALDEALRLMLDSAEPWPAVHGWEEWMGVRFATVPRERATTEALRVLDLIEALQREQRIAEGRRELFAVWTEAYYWLGGRLFEGGSEDQALAFEVGERMRARVLRESRRLSAVTGDDSPVVQAAVLRDALGLGDVSGGRVKDPEPGDTVQGPRGAPGVVSIESARAALGPDEALLVYQLGLDQGLFGRPGGGAWLVAIHSEGVRRYRLPGRETLDGRLRLLTGLIARGDGTEDTASRRVFDDLLTPALGDLPSEVDHLIVVADGSLLRLPMAALVGPDGQRLAERYSLSLAPSATLWWESRIEVDPSSDNPWGVLVLADPASRGVDVEEFAPLPHARREGRSVVRRIGGTLWTGGDAGEDRLRSTDLEPYAILHLAAHAVVDPADPEGSLVRLAADGRHDGDLRPSEIAELDLRGRLVVLSACRGADGQALAGEGVQSLARAFFQAGADAVVAGLWPVRDDRTAELVDRLYRGLIRGEPLAQALAQAQIDRLAEGEPASSWGAWQVLGNGGWRWPGRPDAPPSTEGEAAEGQAAEGERGPISCGVVLLGLGMAALFAGIAAIRRRAAGPAQDS